MKNFLKGSKIENVLGLDFKYDIYLVGGAVRDLIIDSNSTPKDIDLCIVAPFDEIKNEVKRLGGEVFVEKPEYLTVRCKLPELGAVDIAVARKDGEYFDGRRPSETFIANDIREDLARRDATINAIAVDLKTGEVVDPFHGLDDIKTKTIRAVGNAEDRIKEDYLRILRYFRFSITKSFKLHQDIHRCMIYMEYIKGLENVSQERIREEIFKCFKFDTLETMKILNYYEMLRDFIFSGDMWLKPTMEGK